MITVNYKSKFSEPCDLMLGFFDGMHKGHRELLKQTDSKSKKALFTFTDNYSLKDSKVIFTYTERLEIYKKAGVEVVIYADFDDDFKNTEAKDFLQILNSNFSIQKIICGYDYTFGKDALGNSELIETFCEKNNIKFKIIDKILFGGEKASSSKVKKLLFSGDIKNVNSLLGDNYFVTGRVSGGRKVGRTMGFPTANIQLNDKKAQIKKGVYKVYSYIDGKKYYGLLNYGAKPTFDDYKNTFEVFYKDFTGNLYGKELTVFFIDFIRDIQKFDSPDMLKERIKKDLENLND